MKFLLQIEVEAPELEEKDSDFPKSVYAQMRLQEWLQEARTAQLHYLMSVVSGKMSFTDEGQKKAYMAAVEAEVQFIDASVLTVTDLPSQAVFAEKINQE